MDAAKHSTEHDGRLLLTLAIAVLAGASATALGRVFEGPAPAARLVLAGGAAVLVGTLLERRHVALSLTVATVGLLTLLGLTVFPRTTWFGLPTMETVQTLARALGRVGQHAGEQKAPVEAIPSIFSASLIGVWCAAYASHLLAARAGSPVLALLPPAAILGFTGIVLDGGPELGHAGAFLVASMAVLFAAGLRDLRLWGPVLPRRPRQSLRIAGGPVGRRARWLGAGALAGALLLPGILPGYGSDPVIDVDGRGGRVAISPLVDIRPSLRRTEPIELFTVRAERAAYWRLFTVDRFTGRLWISTEEEGIQGSTVVQGRETLPEEGSRGRGRALRQEFTITGLGGSHFPAAYVPWSVDLPAAARYDPVRGTLASVEGAMPRDVRYSVVSSVLSPAAAELDRPFDFSGVPDRYRDLPSDLPPAVTQLAEELTAGTRSPFRQALALQSYLRSFEYDEAFPAGHGTDDLLYFLEQRRGYCEQFSATMAVFLRALGYPARVAVGFTPGTRDPSGVYRVTTDEAHAWTEMYFPGYGWLAFEPTPTRANPVAASYLDASVIIGGSEPDGRLDPPIPGASGNRAGQLEHFERRTRGTFGEGGIDPEGLPAEQRPGWLLPALGLLGLVLLAVAAVPTAKAIRRRRRLRRARTPDQLVLAAFGMFEGHAADLGLGRRPDETLEEYRVRLRAAVRFSDGHLERLTGLAARALYSDRPSTPEEAVGALQDARAGRLDLRRHVGRPRALVGAVRPYPPDGLSG
jgi:hypothetical protein